MFSRQLIAFGRAGDMVVGFSTSGNSANLIAGLRRVPPPRDAQRRPGRIRRGPDGPPAGDVDHCFVVGAESVHRIQETQAALGLSLWTALQRLLGRERCDVTQPGGAAVGRAKRPSWSASRPSGADVRGCATRSSPWPTAPGARHRRP